MEMTDAVAKELEARRSANSAMPNNALTQDINDYRVAVFGSAGVGKSSLVQRFVDGTFRDGYVPTVEDTYRKVISSNKAVCTLQVTDTTGSHSFPAMQRLSIQRGHGFILVYSVSNKQSLPELKPIYDEIVDTKGGIEMVPLMLVGNKCDDVGRQIPETEGQKMAKQWNCAFIETSAKNNYNIQEVFEQLLHLEKRRTMSLETESKRKKKEKKSKAAERAAVVKNKCQLM